jgi:hypothetical protein
MDAPSRLVISVFGASLEGMNQSPLAAKSSRHSTIRMMFSMQYGTVSMILRFCYWSWYVMAMLLLQTLWHDVPSRLVLLELKSQRNEGIAATHSNGDFN